MAQQHINVSTPNDGLGDTLRASQVKSESNFNELYGNKVDKVIGKVLSDVNFSAEDKEKLDNLDPLAGTQSNWDQGDNLEPDFIKNKPENVSEFFNDGEGGGVPFVLDVEEVGVFARSAGEWVPVTVSIICKRYTGLGQDYTLPTGAVSFQAFINEYPHFPEEAGFESDLNTFTQTGTTVTFKETIEAGSRIRILYTI